MFQKNIIPSWLKKTIRIFSVTLSTLLFTQLSLAVVVGNGDILKQAGIGDWIKNNLGMGSVASYGFIVAAALFCAWRWKFKQDKKAAHEFLLFLVAFALVFNKIIPMFFGS